MVAKLLGTSWANGKTWENMGKHGKHGENGGKLFGKLFSALKWTQVEDS